MLKLFEKNSALQVTLVIVATLLMWARPLAHPAAMEPAAGYAPLYDLLYNLSPAPLVAVLAAMVLVVLGGFYLNITMANHGLVSQNSLLPALLYIIFMSATATTLTPILVANLLVLAINHLLLLRGTLLTVSSDKIFGAAALISICSMVYLPMLALLASYLLVVVNYRLYSWRDWVILLLGLLAPYIILWTVHFLADDLQQSLFAMGEGLTDIHLLTQPLTAWPAVANLLLVAVLVVSLVGLWRRLGENPIAWQKNAITAMLPTVSGIIILLYSHILPVQLQFFALPFALCGTHLLTAGSKSRLRRQPSWKTHVLDSLLVLIIIAAVIC